MSKFDEILNSSDASDALLGEQIDKINCGWTKVGVATGNQTTYFGDVVITGYYNKFLRRVVLIIKGDTKTAIDAGKAVGIAFLNDSDWNNLLPSSLVYSKCSDVYDIAFAKNSTNQYIALTNFSSTAIPVGTHIEAQLEYTIAF